MCVHGENVTTEFEESNAGSGLGPDTIEGLQKLQYFFRGHRSQTLLDSDLTALLKQSADHFADHAGSLVGQPSLAERRGQRAKPRGSYGMPVGELCPELFVGGVGISTRRVLRQDRADYAGDEPLRLAAGRETVLATEQLSKALG